MNGFPSYPDDFLNKLRQDDCFFIIGHISPDGDCLYSELAMQALLTEMGKVSYVANAGPFERSEIAAQRSQFLQHMPSNLKAKNPTVIVVDCSTPDRIGSFINEINGLSIMVIDHHQSGEPFGDYRFVFSESPSTTLLIQHLFVQLGLKITPNIAHLLFFGFATDSGFFKFLNAGQGTVLRMVADLVDAGVSPNEIYSEMSGGKELAYVQYLGKLIERTQAFFDGRVLCSYCYLSDNDKYNTNDKPSDALYTQLLSVEVVKAVMLFKEQPEGKTEVGFRSTHKSNVDVGLLASTFGGGGHKCASGLTVSMSIEEIREKLLAELKKQLI